MPIQINDPTVTLRLVYVDDVISAFIAALQSVTAGFSSCTVTPEYSIKLGELLDQIRTFNDADTI